MLHLLIDSIHKGQGCNDKVSKGKACLCVAIAKSPKRSHQKPRFTCAEVKNDQKPRCTFD
jgi:hypothetical protein